MITQDSITLYRLFAITTTLVIAASLIVAGVHSAGLFEQHTVSTAAVPCEVSFEGTGTGEIPDGFTGASPPYYGLPLNISFPVSGLSGEVIDVSVRIDATHRWIGDVDAVLSAPNGNPNMVIFGHVGAQSETLFGDSSDLGGIYTFSDAATVNIWSAAAGTNGSPPCGGDCVVPSGIYRTTERGGRGQIIPSPVTSLYETFAGLTPEKANGVWTLTVRDGAAVEKGDIESATLVLKTSVRCPPATPTPTNTPTSTPTPTATPTPFQVSSVNIGTAPAGLSYTVDSQVYNSSRTFDFGQGTSHVISVGGPQSSGEEARYIWDSWSDGGAQTHTIQANGGTFVALFKKQFLLTMGSKAGIVSPSTGFFDTGESVRIFAEQGPPGLNVTWVGSGNGSYTGTNNPATVLMHGPISQVATWTATTPTATPTPTPTPVPFAVTVQTNPPGRSFTVDGVTYSSAQTFNWVEGSIHSIGTNLIQGMQSTRFIFDNWSDGGTLDHTITANAATSAYTLSFRTQHFLSVCCPPFPFFSVSPGSAFQDASQRVFISGSNGPGFGGITMNGWNGSGNGSYTGPQNGVEVVMNGPISQGAIFSILPNPGIVGDYDGDRRTDISVFRPSDATWYVNRSSGTPYVLQFGLQTDELVPADYDGDDKTDIAVFRPSDGNWYIARSSSGTLKVINWGVEGDLAAPGDFFPNDGAEEAAVFRPSTGVWHLQYTSIHFGQAGDVPAVGDYDGDRKTDIGVYRPSTGAWYVRKASGGDFALQFGLPGDIPVPARWGPGSGTTKMAVFRPSNGTWYVLRSGTYTAYQFGAPGDIPVPGYYDGDAIADYAVFRPSNGYWYIANSSNGTFTILPWGMAGDIPTQSVFGHYY